MSTSKNEQEILMQILQENKLTGDSILYRSTSEKHLETNQEGSNSISANNEPVEMVVDRYRGSGHTFMAKDIGPGLAFTTEKVDELHSENRVYVQVLIKDILNQGGLIYPVTSVPEYMKAFFFTLPGGEVKDSIEEDL